MWKPRNFFISTSTGGLGSTYYWEFGAGGAFGTSTEPSPTEDIIIPGGGFLDVPITLTITDVNGCQSTQTQDIQIGQSPNPGNDLVILPICTSLSNNESDSITLIFTPEPFFQGGIDQILIDWGLGDTLTYIPPTFPSFEITSPGYNSFGTYPINIDLLGFNGCITTINDELFVGSNPQIGSTAPGNTSGLCSPVELTYPLFSFINNAENTIYTVEWGDDSVEIFTHQELLDVMDPTTEIAYLSHDYNISSCGFETPNGYEDSFYFKVSAENECDETIFSFDPVVIHLEPNPVISGDTITCVNNPTTFTCHQRDSMCHRIQIKKAVRWRA